MTAIELVRRALAEDKHEFSHLGARAFRYLFRKENPKTVQEAWLIYDEAVSTGKPATAIWAECLEARSGKGAVKPLAETDLAIVNRPASGRPI